MTPSPTPVPDVSWLVGPLTGDGVATILAAVIAALVVAVGYAIQQKWTRQARQAILYGDAIQAVHDYLELPYRVRRRDGGGTARMAVTSHASDVQSRVSYHVTLLRIHAPKKISRAYLDLVIAAKAEAGPQMSAAWVGKPTRRDHGVPLRERYRHPRSDAAMEQVIKLMGGPGRENDRSATSA